MKSEAVLSVGRRGEIYTSKKIREETGISEGGKVRAIVEGHKLIVEAIPTIEDAMRDSVIELSPEEAERLSEEAQREGGVHG